MLETDDAIQKVVDLAAATCKVIETEPLHMMLVPEGYNLTDLEKYQFSERPMRLKKELEVLDVDSFVEYYNGFDDPNSRIFCNVGINKFQAVLDYHEMGDPPKPRFGEHKVSLTLKYSLEWTIWSAINGVQKTQAEFAAHVEDNLADISIPAQAIILEAARSLKGKKDVEFGSDVKESNGSMMFKYSEQVSARVSGGEIEVPDTFTLRIPIFKNEAPQDILCRLRYRINQEKRLIFWFVMARPSKLVEDSVNAIIKRIETDTKTPVLLANV